MKKIKFPNKITRVIQKNITELLDKPKHLAWCMMCYTLACAACHESGYECPYPKEIIYNNREKYFPNLSKKQYDILFNAWKITVSMNLPIDFPYSKIKSKMTFEDWVEAKTDPNYRYRKNNRYEVSDEIFCTLGGYCSYWEDGYLVFGQDDIPEYIYYGYSQVEDEINPKIKPAIFKICSDAKIKDNFLLLYKSTVDINKMKGEILHGFINNVLFSPNKFKLKEYPKLIEDANNSIFPTDSISELLKKAKITEENSPKTESRIAREEGRLFYPFSDKYSVISNIPDNAHPSYIIEAMRICRTVLCGKGCIYNIEKYGMVSPCTKSMLEVSQKFVDKWSKLGY